MLWVVSAFGKSSAIKPVSHAANTDEISRFCGISLDLLAERGNVVIDDTVGEKRVLPPGFVQQLLPRKDTSTISNESGQHFELCRRHFHKVSGTAYLATHGIDFYIAEAIHVGFFVLGLSSQCGTNPGAKFFGAKRLRHVVIGAKIEAQYFLGLLCLGRQHDDGCADAGTPQLAADIESILGGKHYVEQDEIELSFPSAFCTDSAVGCKFNIPSFQP